MGTCFHLPVGPRPRLQPRHRRTEVGLREGSSRRVSRAPATAPRLKTGPRAGCLTAVPQCSGHRLPGASRPITLSPSRDTVTVNGLSVLDAGAWAAGRDRRSEPGRQGSVECVCSGVGAAGGPALTSAGGLRAGAAIRLCGRGGAGVADEEAARGTGTGVPALALPRVIQAASSSRTAAIMQRDHDSRAFWTQQLNPESPLCSLGQ